MLGTFQQINIRLCPQVRGMATLKDIAVRVKSVKNIQKITKSMKMVSAAKFNKAERELRTARPYGHGAKEFYEKAEVKAADGEHILIAVTSDRGLCGGANSGVVKAVRLWLAEHPELAKSSRIVAIGDKSRSMLQRQNADKMLMHVTEVGKKPPTFADASEIALTVMNEVDNFEHATMFFNTFRTMASYKITQQSLFSLRAVSRSEKLNLYDSVDDEVLRSYNEFMLTSLIYFGLKEAAASEQSARMTAMDSASKNAGEMIDKLSLLYNRTRQASITRELTEIISGAAALE